MKKIIVTITWTLVFFVITKSGVGQDVRLTNYTTNNNPKVFKKICIVGAGSSASRAFLENLSKELIKHFEEKDIKAEYFYLGKKERGSVIDIKSLPIKDFDGLIIFNPSDTAISLAETRRSSVDVYGIYGGTFSINSYHVNYKERFDVLFYEAINIQKPIWEAALGVNGDFSKNKIYLNAAKKMISSMENNFLIPEKNIK
jgi:hypothetical protein